MLAHFAFYLSSFSVEFIIFLGFSIRNVIQKGGGGKVMGEGGMEKAMDIVFHLADRFTADFTSGRNQ